MKFDNLLRYAVRILTAYKGEIPLTGWLKNFFRENPQMGSRDRKQVSEMVYCFFRPGHSLKNIPPEERIKAGLFLSNSLPEPILEYFYPEWHAQTNRPLEEKLMVLQGKYPDFDPLEIFPWKNKLSEGMDHRAYCLSFLEKPRLFIRIRPGMEDALHTRLNYQGLFFQDADPSGQLPFKTYSF